MQLVGEAIRHDLFGKGVVTDWSGRSLTISFQRGEKRFLYPEAFADHLTLKNAEKQNAIEGLIQKKKDAKEAHRQQIILEEEKRQRLRQRTAKISACSQAAFDVDDPEKVFSAWTVSTGTYLSGPSKGTARIPDRMKPNSLCLITTKPKDAPEKDRRIMGAFMVQEDFLGTSCRDGVVTAHPDYRLKLASDEQVLFWPYTGLESKSQKWGKATFKYMANTLIESILYDIRNSIVDAEKKKDADKLYRYYCSLNRLTAKNMTTKE